MYGNQNCTITTEQIENKLDKLTFGELITTLMLIHPEFFNGLQ